MVKAFSIEVETAAFNQHIKEFLAGVNVDTVKGVKKFAFDLTSRIIKKTPIRTGRARGGWLVAYDKLGGFDSPVSFGRSGGHFSSAAVSKGKSEGGYRESTKRGPYFWVEIINGVDYIIFLEYGYSKQSPYGMVRVSMRELRGAALVKDLSNYYKRRWNRFYSGPHTSYGV
jgi:hypothetical protein